MVAAPCTQGCGIRYLPLGQFDKGARGLSPFLMRHGDNGRDRDCRVTIERLFHLDGRDVLAPRDDE